MSWELVASAFSIGLLGSTHCAGMCGGIVAASQVGAPADGRRRLPQLSRAGNALAQNAGRVVSYAAAGALMGGVGALVGRSAALDARPVLETCAALVLIATGASLAGLLPATASLERLGGPLWRALQPLARRFLPMDTPARALAFGLLWGLVPCGLVYSALSLAAVSGGAATGALVMLAFGAGTLPMLAALTALAGFVARLVRRPVVRRGAGFAIVAFGVLQLAMVANRMREPAPCCARATHASRAH
jgi:hypothetical protein